MAEFEMPVDIIMPAPLQEAPEVHEPTPRELFAAHVEAVRQTGDAFDERTDLQTNNALLFGGLLGLPAATISTEHFGLADPARALILSGLVLAASLPAQKAVKNHAQERAKAKFDIETQQQNDAFYELYRTDRRDDGTYNVAMHWLGNMRNEDNNTGDEELTRVVELAKANEISEVVVRCQLTSDAYMYLGDLHDTNLNEWLKETKGLTFNMPLGEAYAATPDQWLAAIAKKPLHYQYKDQDDPLKKVGYLSGNHAGIAELIPKRDAQKIVAEGKDLILSEQGSPKKVAIPVRYPMTVRNMYSVQEQHAAGYQVADRGIKMDTRRRTVIKAAAAIAAAGILVAAPAVFDNELSKRESEAAAQLINEAGIPVQDQARVVVDPNAVRERVDSWSSVNSIWGDWRDIRKSIHNLGQSDDAPSSASSAANTGSGIGGGVGNVNDISLVPVWSLTPHNLPDSALAGHWSVDTASVLEATTGKDGVPALAWNQHAVLDAGKNNHGDTEGAIVHKLPATVPENTTQETIEVEGTIASAGDASVLKGILPIPALEGYSVAAANINGEPVDVEIKKDNTYVLSVGPAAEQDDRINYWLTRNENRRVKSADGFWLLPESNTSNDAIINYKGLREVLRIGKDGKMLKAAEFVAYSHDNFTYSYAPWPEEEVAKQKDVAGLIGITMSEKEANCNAAGTALILSDPADKSPVFEFNNKTGARTLVGKDAHMRVVDTEGQTYDATPTLPAVVKPEKRDEPAPIPVGILILTGGVAIASALGFKNRRRVAAVTNASATKFVEHAAGDTMRAAVAATEHALWSGPDAQINATQIAEAKADQAMTAKQAAAALADPEHHNKAVRDHLSRQKAVTGLQRLAVKIAAVRAARATAKSNAQARKTHTPHHRAQ